MKQVLSILIPVFLTFFFACENNTSSTNGQSRNGIDTTNLVNTMGSPLIADLTEKIEKNAKDPKLFATRAQIYYDKENYVAAISDLQKAIEMDSTAYPYYHLLADSYLDNFQSEEAISVLEMVVEKAPDRISSLLKLSEFQLLLQQHEGSFATVNKILEQSPRNAEGFYMLGMNFKAIGDTARAVKSFQTTVEEDSDHIDAYTQLALMYDRGKNNVALRYFDNVLRIDSISFDALFGKAWFYHQRNKFNDAEFWYEKAGRYHPKESKVHLNHGILNLERTEVKGQSAEQRKTFLEKAYRSFDLATKVDVTYGLAYYYRGIAQESLNKPKKAAGDYRQAAVLMENPDRANKALERMGQDPVLK